MPISFDQLRRIDACRWEIPKDYKPYMRVPGIVFADEVMIKDIVADQSLEQVANGASLPGIQKASLAMPDIHYGYGLPIGGVVATDIQTGVVSPGATGYDINCGVRLVRTNLERKQIGKDTLKTIVNALFEHVPMGVGSRGDIRLSPKDYRDILVQGSGWAVKHGYGTPEDLGRTEAEGCLKGADPDKVSPRAYERGQRQVGTLGSGNHFVEVQYVEEIYEENAARQFGLSPGQITVMIHTGSRGFGHQICTDYLEVMDQALKRYHIELPDRQLACAPYDSPEGQDYLAAMRAAANYAWVNRQCLMHLAKISLEEALHISPNDLGFELVYDVAHNVIKVEPYTINGKTMSLAVHRKGATRAFPAGHPELPEIYRSVGQPVLIPGDMGRCSYVLVGTQTAVEQSFASTCHGAGRRLSRHAAIKAAKGRAINRELEDQGIIVRSVGRDSLKEEMPEAYKDVSQVVNIVHQAGISTKVAKLRPIGVIKG